MITFSKKNAKLLVLIFTVLWLIIKSPLVFIPLTSTLECDKTNPMIVYSYYLEFVIWLILSIPLFMFAFTKQDLKAFVDKNKLLLLITSNFAFASFRAFKSFDVTDNGFHLSKAWGVVNGSFDVNLDFWFGSSFVNGLWLSILDYPYLLWARFGWILVVCLISYTTHKIISLYYSDFFSFLVVFSFSFLFIKYNYYMTINYDNFSFLLTLCSAYIILKNNQKLLPDYYIIASGLLLGLAFFIKFNYILIFTLPLIVYLFDYEYNKITLKDFLKKIGYSYLGVSLVLIVFISLLAINGKAGLYCSYLNDNLIKRVSPNSNDAAQIYSDAVNFGNKNIVESDNKPGLLPDSLYFFLSDSLKNDSLRQNPLYSNSYDSHSMKNLFDTYFIGFWQVVKTGIMYLVALLVLFLLLSKIKGRIIKYLLLTTAAILFYYTSKIKLDGEPHIFLSALIFPGYLLFFIHNKKYKLLFLSITIILISLFSFPGSDLVFNVLYRSGAGLLLMVFPVVYLYGIVIKCNWCGNIDLSYYSKLMMIFIIIATYSSWDYINCHRDLQDRSLLITMFKSPQLVGIHSTPQRVKVVDELLTFFNNEKYEKNKTPALFVSWIPMFYYLTQTNCLFSAPWHVGDQLTYFTKTLTDNNVKPKYITISDVFTRNSNWPLADKQYKKLDPSWIAQLRINDFTRYYIARHHYQKVFHNEMFEVYKLPEKNIQIDTLKSIEAEK